MTSLTTRSIYYTQQHMNDYIERVEEARNSDIKHIKSFQDDSFLTQSITEKGFELSHWIDEGKYGQVYKVKHKATQVARAIKIHTYKYFFSLEVQLLKKIKNDPHPNLVEFVELFKTPCDPGRFPRFIIVLSCHPINLYEFYSNAQGRNLPLSLETIGHIAKGTLSGLQHLFEKLHIVHLDIKPENLLLDSMNVVKIADFGNSKEIKADTQLPDFETVSRWYRSPRVLTLDAIGNDVFSVAAVIVEIATFRPLFGISEEGQEAVSVEQKMRNHLTKVFGILGDPSAAFKEKVSKSMLNQVFEGSVEFPKYSKIGSSVEALLKNARAPLNEPPEKLKALQDFCETLLNYEAPPSYEKALKLSFVKEIENIESVDSALVSRFSSLLI